MSHENYSESVSSFINWAHNRLDQEIEQNNKIEEEYGTSEIFKDHVRLSHNLSIEEKLDYIYEVERLSKKFSDVSKAEVCSLAGIFVGTYYKWKRQAMNSGHYNSQFNQASKQKINGK